MLIDTSEKLDRENHCELISLNANKFNTPLSFYKKIGIEIVCEEDIELDFGYLIEDYKREKQL